MAVIGQQLLQPDAGWKRYDDKDTKFSYVGTWSTSAVPTAYNGSVQSTAVAEATVSFKFTGTRLRIIGYHSNNRSSDMKINIDGQTETFSQYANTSVISSLVYEKQNLSNTLHTVTITSGTT